MASNRYTPEQYLAIERQAEFKSELVMGEMLGMAGGSIEHNTIAGNVYGHLLSNFKELPVVPSTTT